MKMVNVKKEGDGGDCGVKMMMMAMKMVMVVIVV
jgi:hypothetical protein